MTTYSLFGIPMQRRCARCKLVVLIAVLTLNLPQVIILWTEPDIDLN